MSYSAECNCYCEVEKKEEREGQAEEIERERERWDEGYEMKITSSSKGLLSYPFTSIFLNWSPSHGVYSGIPPCHYLSAPPAPAQLSTFKGDDINRS